MVVPGKVRLLAYFLWHTDNDDPVTLGLGVLYLVEISVCVCSYAQVILVFTGRSDVNNR
jgi:hypothetical protein